MKKILVVSLLFLITLFCSSCGDSSGTREENIDRYDTAYNTKTDVSIKIGESVKSVNKKISEDKYQRVTGEDGGYCYLFREDDNMEFDIWFTQDDTVAGFLMRGASDAENVAEVTKADCDWSFKGGISAKTTKEEMDTSFGLPSVEYSSESEGNQVPAGTYQCEYYFDENIDLISPEEYKKMSDNNVTISKVKYSALAFMMDNKLYYFELGLTNNS